MKPSLSYRCSGLAAALAMSLAAAAAPPTSDMPPPATTRPAQPPVQSNSPIQPTTPNMPAATSPAETSPAAPTDRSTGLPPPATADALQTTALAPLARFEDLDRNKDGTLSRDEIPATMDLASILSSYDLNADGRLSPTEYARLKADRERLARTKFIPEPERR